MSKDTAPPVRLSSVAILVYAALLTAVLYQLLFHLAPDAPMRNPGRPPEALARLQGLLISANKAVATAAAGRNIELHFPSDPQSLADNAKLFSTIYFSANYAMYPQRIFAGKDDAIINNAAELYSADHLPSDDWLAHHQVAAVVSLLPSVDDTGPHALIHRLP